MTTSKSIGFIGLGMLGKPMAENLLQDGYCLRVYNRSPEKAASLEQLGAIRVSTPQETAQPGGIVLSCVADDTAIEAVVGKADELASRLGPEGVHVSMSTILPETAEALATRHAAQGCHYVAAPVMGRPDVVKAKKQSFFIAGNAQAKARIQSLLESISQRVFDFGPKPADANIAKLAANFLIAASLEAMSEAFAFMTKSGADPALLQEALGSTLFACPIYQNYGRQILDANYETPLFKLALGLKDMGLVRSSAGKHGAPMRFAEVLHQRFTQAVANGRSNCDWTAIAAEVRQEAGL